MKIFREYIKIALVALIVIFLLRIIESAFIVYSFGYKEGVLIHELLGFLLDIVVIGFFLSLWFFLYRYLFKKKPRFTNALFLIGIIGFDVLHLTFLKYFLYQLRPLDIFLYSHSMRESLFSYNTSNTNYSDMILISIFISTVVILSFNYIKKQSISDKEAYRVKWLLLSTIILFPIFEIFGIFSFNNFSINKSYYFFKRSIGYVFKKEKRKYIKYDDKLFKKYQNIYNQKDYLTLDYPMLHKFENKDVLGKYFNKKEESPNLVFLIVEGMSDEFIHEYKGLKLMPYIDSLSKNSLYWNNFFTLGERSFAVVPSIMGGLPYGEKGFMLLNTLPYHYSLVNILKKNGYYSIYFDSQDAWFHDKDKYFNFNNIDKIFDKNNFSDKYNKIRVGKENYFWGFTDKDLFSQALEVMDTIPSSKRMEVYFTGTMHSPFEIKEHEKYEKLFNSKLGKIKDERIKHFFTTYKKQVLSLLFTNDAIKDFIESYKNKSEYENTIFFITGDHPMTEIPPKDGVKKYHVPFIIYSPLLKTAKTFSNISSHLDVYETLLSYLNANFNTEIPVNSTSIGYKLDTSSVKIENRVYTFMNDNREIVDIYNKGNFLSNERYVFRMKDDFKIYEIRNRELKKGLRSKLKNFNNVNSFVYSKNKLLPEKEYMDFFNYRVLYSFVDTTCHSFNNKYSYIIKDVPIDNKQIYIDISLDFIPEINEKTTVNYSLTTKNGEVKYSNSFSLAYKLQEHTRINKILSDDPTLLLSVYLDNKVFEYVEYCNPHIKVYSYNN